MPVKSSADPNAATITAAMSAAKSAARSLEELAHWTNGGNAEINAEQLLLDIDADLTNARRAVRSMLAEYQKAGDL
jgi:hypothetical protein